MRKRDIQNFTLKLSDLKEYDIVKQERAAASKPPDKTEESPSSSQAPEPIANVGRKTMQEIRDRIGYFVDLMDK